MRSLVRSVLGFAAFLAGCTAPSVYVAREAGSEGGLEADAARVDDAGAAEAAVDAALDAALDAPVADAALDADLADVAREGGPEASLDDARGEEASAGPARVALSVATPRLRVRLADRGVLTVRAMRVAGARADDLSLRFEGLPRGVTVAGAELFAAFDEAEVTLTATREAAVTAATRVRVRALAGAVEVGDAEFELELTPRAGVLDTSFGVAGRVAFRGGPVSLLTGLGAAGDAPLVAGSLSGATNSAAVWRFDASGAPLAGFGSPVGEASVGLSSTGSGAAEVTGGAGVHFADGSAWLLANIAPASRAIVPVLVKLRADGTLDPTFVGRAEGGAETVGFRPLPGPLMTGAAVFSSTEVRASDGAFGGLFVGLRVRLGGDVTVVRVVRLDARAEPVASFGAGGFVDLPDPVEDTARWLEPEGLAYDAGLQRVAVAATRYPSNNADARGTTLYALDAATGALASSPGGAYRIATSGGTTGIDPVANTLPAGVVHITAEGAQSSLRGLAFDRRRPALYALGYVDSSSLLDRAIGLELDPRTLAPNRGYQTRGVLVLRCEGSENPTGRIFAAVARPHGGAYATGFCKPSSVGTGGMQMRYNFALFALGPAGAPDADFAQVGINPGLYTDDVSGALLEDYGTALGFDASGRLLAAVQVLTGASGGASPSRLVLLRFHEAPAP